MNDNFRKDYVVALNDMEFRVDTMIGFSKSIMPTTNLHPEMYTITVWLQDVAEPVTCVYETKDVRDLDYATLQAAWKRSPEPISFIASDDGRTV